jgi:hemoglobin
VETRPSLYDRLGGVYAIATVVDDFIDRIMSDPRLNANPLVDEAHHRVSKAGFKYLVTELVCQVTGGPQKYSGRTMLDSHRHLNIAPGEWEAFLDDFRQTLDRFGVPDGERAELFAIVDSTRGDIVIAPPPPDALHAPRVRPEAPPSRPGLGGVQLAPGDARVATRFDGRGRRRRPVGAARARCARGLERARSLAMPILIVLVHETNEKESVELLRWATFPNDVQYDSLSKKVTWSAGFGGGKTFYSLPFEGKWQPVASKIFEAEHLKVAVGKFGTVFDYRYEPGPKGLAWSGCGVAVEEFLAPLAPMMRQFLVLPKGETLPDVTVSKQSILQSNEPFAIKTYVFRRAALGRPLCLVGDHLKEAPKVTKISTTTTSELTPCPGYWPVTRVFVKQSQVDLCSAVEVALTSCKSKPDLVPIVGYESTFLRDYWVNLYGKGGSANLSTTKNKGLGFLDGGKLSGTIKCQPASAAESGFGFGGNYLSVETEKVGLALFYGGCETQVGDHADTEFMINKLLETARVDTLVAIDTGWLKVGHVDEIMSFPRPSVALLASPASYQKIASGKGCDHLELNKDIELKLAPVEGLMKSLGLKVLRVPVWFKPVSGDPMHATSVRGNAVNCIYIGDKAIHSRSGPNDGETRENGASGVVDLYVEQVMKEVGYASLFVNMQDANDEGGAGGNVHCASYTVHQPLG